MEPRNNFHLINELKNNIKNLKSEIEFKDSEILKLKRNTKFTKYSELEVC